VVDAENLDLDFIRAYKSECEIQEAVFTKGEQRFGAFVSLPDAEDEFGKVSNFSLFLYKCRVADISSDSLAHIFWQGRCAA
jgi:hypothetical protein